MGVRGLQTFLEQYCPESCYTVNLAKLIEEYSSKTGKPAEIVVDAQSCYNHWCAGIDWTVGFEIQEFVHRLRTFVEAFKKVGAKLVFIFGGLTPEKKRETWIQRRRKNVGEIHEVFDFLAAGNTVKDLPGHINSLPPNMGVTASFVLKYILGCEVYLTVEECDEEVIQYAHKNHSFAIFSQDTDFIISDLNAVVLSSRNFNSTSMTATLYDRVELAKRLKIEVKQLPFLALLAGNDFVSHESISSFHHRVCGLHAGGRSVPYQVLMPALGRYIRSLPDASLDTLLTVISQNLFRSCAQVDRLKMAYNSYLTNPAPAKSFSEDNWSRILYVAEYRHKNTMTPALLYSILSEQVFEFSTSFEDLRKIHNKNTEPRMLPSATITRPLRLRLYGVLLYEKKSPPITVSEWCGENVDSYKTPVVVDPVKPTVRHPGLIALWSDNNSDRMVEMRWNLFFQSVSSKMKASEWTSLPEELLIPTVSLYYLYSENFVNRYEVDAVAATLATYPLYSRKKLEGQSFSGIDLRAAHISLTFIRTYGFVLTLLAACGYPIGVSADIACMKFEGKLFQIKYNALIVKKQRYNDVCENDTCLEVFYRIKNKIYRTPSKPGSGTKPRE